MSGDACAPGQNRSFKDLILNATAFFIAPYANLLVVEGKQKHRTDSIAITPFFREAQMLAAATQVSGMPTGRLLALRRLPNTRPGCKEYHRIQRNLGTMIEVLIHISYCEITSIFCYEGRSASANSAKFYAYENFKRGVEERKKEREEERKKEEERKEE